MRQREARAASLPAPPVALCRFGQWWDAGSGYGMDVYASRAEWVAARRDWESRHGLTLADWARRTHAELLARAGTLDEVNEVLDLTFVDGDEDDDPR